MLWINIDQKREISLTRQVYTEIRNLILSAVLSAGARLPSSRELAVQLGVSRNVILEAYDQLRAEGYVVSRHGSGTRVAKGAILEKIRSEQERKTELNSKKSSSGGLLSPDNEVIDFRSGLPAIELFS